MRETLYLIDMYGFDIFVISHNNDYDILGLIFAMCLMARVLLG